MPEGQTAPPPLPKWQPSFGKRNSTIIKLLGVGALVLLLLVPLAMITGVLKERLQRRNEAVADITSSWGSEQNVIGPMMGVPYQYKFKVVKEVPGSRIHNRCDRVAGYRTTDCKRNRIFHSTRFQWERRNIFRA